MQRLPLRASWLALLIIFTLALAACGSDEDDGPGETAADYPATTAPPEDAKKGGTLTVINAADIDFLDPGAGYYQPTYMIDFASQRTLVGWPPDATGEPQPDMAAAQPKVSEDFKTVTFKIREGVKYSPPVDREVTSADHKYAIERGLLPGVATGYHSAYFGDLVGYDAAVAAAERNDTVAPDISGITTPDDRTLVMKLDKPTSATLVQALSLPIGAPVPEDYAAEFDAESPSTYAEHLVATGPYMIENDEQGNVTGYKPGRSITLVRNPNWDASTDYRPAYVDKIDWREGFTDVNSATRRILTGDSQINGDILAEPQGLKLAATEYPDQLELAPASGGSRYISLNTSIPPFDDINVRKAVIASADRDALRLARGGPLSGGIATHFLSPDIPGYEEAGGAEGPDLDFLANPRGDKQLAAEYMRKAGFESGKYDGPPILMIGENAGTDKQVTAVVRDIFAQLGFDVNLRQFSSDTAYTRFCNVPDSNYNVCATTGWVKDFNDAQSVLDVPFSGENIVSTNNSNWPLLDDPKINKAINQAALVADPQERTQAWGEVDEQITALAPAIPYLWDTQPNTRSANVNGVLNLFNATWDLSFTSLKNP